ncbi:hypothetical protein G6F37_006075 [Rhizopus arrhizus]|nr:hypothetical protein G6F38_006233 [Rhizopus arrhizus]KAG1158128.1 hypothetical protein G6F37_006075 [Rhizopus arrhizus]
MSAIVTHFGFDASKEEIRAMSMWRDKKYMQPMVEESLKGKYSLVKANYIPLLFNHLLDLLQLSSHLLKEFKEKPDELGKVLQETEPKFSVFLKYTIHYKHNEKQIRKACNNILFIKINQENLARRDTNRLGMSDYFIAPIQRITRYCLLMKDLQRYSNPPDLELDKALKAMTALAIAMNNV